MTTAIDKILLTAFLSIVCVLVVQCSYKNEQQSNRAFTDDGNFGQYAPKDAYSEDPDFPYYGSENKWDRRFFDKSRRETFYKRAGQAQMLKIADGEPDSTIKISNQYLKDHPNDPESLFNLSVAHSQLNQVDKAFTIMERALEAGLPFERFLAGPREVLKPLVNSEKFKRYHSNHEGGLIHGPLLGDVTPHSAKFWVRMWDESSSVVIKVFVAGSKEITSQSPPVKADPKNDYTAITKVDGLQPNTTYLYNVFINGKPVFNNNYPEFKTFPEEGSSNKINIAFGGCAGYTPRNERIWEGIAERNPDAFLFLGDNVYITLPGMPNEVHNYTYYRRQSRPEFKKLTSTTPIYAIWDDHELLDDIWMGPYVDKPEWKLPILDLFKRNWNNPGYGTKKYPGVWFNFSIGDVEIFMLDTRFYRTNPFKEEKTMLGPVQKEWLKEELKESEATFKIIASSVPWSSAAKPGSNDTWNGFLKEREEIFSYIGKHKIEGIVLLSSDRHRAEAWKIKRKTGYDFYELLNGRLTNIHSHHTMPDAIFSYNQKNTFGELEIDTQKEDPTLTYNIVSIDSEIVHSLTIKHSELTF